MNVENAMNQPDLTTAPPSRANEIDTVARQIAAAAGEMSSEIDNDRRLPDELVARLGAGGLEPPDLEALRRELGLSGTELANLAAAGTVIVSEDLGFVPEHVNRALARLSDAFGEEWFAVTEARQLLDVRRRYALALLYAMDRMRATELRADGLRRVRY
jgi:hypothetical protein